jgi:predicted RNA-binding protein
MPAYWVNTVARDHVRAGVAAGFTQADHGRAAHLTRLKKGDYLVFYSSKTDWRDGDPLQAFTALGRVTDDAPYRVEMTPDFHPWRRRVEYFNTEPAPVRPLIDRLSFIRNKQRWGFPFHLGLFEIPRQDFLLIAGAMGAAERVA